jgi:hypothetical protein
MCCGRGTPDYDTAFGVAADRDGNVSVVGVTYGALGGPNKGDGDAWVIKFERRRESAVEAAVRDE